MPEFFLELFSEEIPARMQRDASIQLERICNDVLRSIGINRVETYYGPRRIAIKAEVVAKSEAKIIEERGPRDSAPEAALAGFMGKHKASREEILVDGGYYWLRRRENPVAASEVVANGLPFALAKFSWPKSMRWGQGGDFTWVRPLRRIVCLLDGEVIPFKLGPVTGSNETEGHRFLAPGAFAVSSASDWEEKLQKRFVIADQNKRRQMIVDGISEKASALGLKVVEDPGLIDEVNGLVEWPVHLIGKIEEDFMDLPPEVREISMKVNQRYFALRDAAGKPAPYFAFVSNIAGTNDVTAIVTGNERVLRARLSDARHFWDMDLRTPLQSVLDRLKKVTFHAKFGTQRDRVDRLQNLSRIIAQHLGGQQSDIDNADAAALFCKADLVSGMVGEFPELQGIIGGYYAEHMIEQYDQKKYVDAAVVSTAIKTHYQPKGPNDAVPTGIVACSVALADKIDTLVQFFGNDEIPTGSSDPYALRRAALGVIRTIIENDLHLPLRQFIGEDELLFEFVIERLRVKLRNEGKRYDVLDAVLAAGTDDDLARIMQRVDAVTDFLATSDGENLLAGYRRAANILKIEDAKDGPHDAMILLEELKSQEAENLAGALGSIRMRELFKNVERDYRQELVWFAQMRRPVDRFFESVTVNAPDPNLRRSRLGLLALLRDTMHQIADFSKIEG
jgi:glycyl-tRNA synthetase beta chain